MGFSHGNAPLLFWAPDFSKLKVFVINNIVKLKNNISGPFFLSSKLVCLYINGKIKFFFNSNVIFTFLENSLCRFECLVFSSYIDIQMEALIIPH